MGSFAARRGLSQSSSRVCSGNNLPHCKALQPNKAASPNFIRKGKSEINLQICKVVNAWSEFRLLFFLVVYVPGCTVAGIHTSSRNLPSRHQAAESASWPKYTCREVVWFWKCENACEGRVQHCIHLLKILSCSRIDLWSNRLHNSHWYLVFWLCICGTHSRTAPVPRRK